MPCAHEPRVRGQHLALKPTTTTTTTRERDALVGNVAAERLALKVDAVDALVRERLGLLERRRRRRDGEDAPAVGQDLALGRRLGAGVEDVDVCRGEERASV